MKQLIFPLALALAFFSCKKDGASHVSPDADFLFSKYYCECIGHCINGYKIADEQLYPGKGSTCLPDSLIFENDPLAQDKLALAEALRDALPALMLNSSQETYGCPDCGDWGGYYLELVQNGNTRSWRLDTHTGGLPGDVKTFVEKLQQTLDDLQ